MTSEFVRRPGALLRRWFRDVDLAAALAEFFRLFCHGGANLRSRQRVVIPARGIAHFLADLH